MKPYALLALTTLALAPTTHLRAPSGDSPAEPARRTVVTVPGDYATIQAAHDAVRSGDTILVAPGTYVEQITLTKAVTLASHFLTTGDASFIARTIIDGGGADFAIEIPRNAEDGATIQGVTIQNADDGITSRARFNLLNCLVRGNDDGVDYERGGGGLVQFCTFEHNDDDGIDLDGAVDVVIADNVIRRNDDDGIEMRMHPHDGPTLNVSITRNVIHNNDEDGIQLIHYDEPTARFISITYNHIYDNEDAGIGMMDNEETREDFRAASIPEPIHIFNNTLAHNSHGITGGDNTVVLNNIFVGHAVVAVKNVDGGSQVARNLFFGNRADHVGSNVDLETSLFADPLLTADRRLQAGSPAIDAGSARYEWRGRTVVDLSRDAFAGAAPDLGGSEYRDASGPRSRSR